MKFSSFKLIYMDEQLKNSFELLTYTKTEGDDLLGMSLYPLLQQIYVCYKWT